MSASDGDTPVREQHDGRWRQGERETSTGLVSAIEHDEGVIRWNWATRPISTKVLRSTHVRTMTYLSGAANDVYIVKEGINA